MPSPGCLHYDPKRTEAEALFGDGSWPEAEVKDRYRDRYGRMVVALEWHPAHDTWTGHFIYVPATLLFVTP